MEKGYYTGFFCVDLEKQWSQSTIKMEKGYYKRRGTSRSLNFIVAIHNKNGKGLLHNCFLEQPHLSSTSQSTIKMEKGYYNFSCLCYYTTARVAIHNKNGKGLLLGREKRYSKNVAKVAIHNKNGKGLLRSKF